MFSHNTLRYIVLLMLLGGALFQAFAAEYFGLEVLTEILILAMLVLALDIVAGFGGMVSLCHGALMGWGLRLHASFHPIWGDTVDGHGRGDCHYGRGCLGDWCGLFAQPWDLLHHGHACFRSDGLFLYLRSAPLWGDDGLGGISRLDLSIIGVDLNDSRSFALFCLAMLAGVYLMSVLILRSGLGRSLTGVMHNEQRMRALGLTVWRVKADVFGLSGMIAGLAGALTAQHIMYISPGLLGWTVSGEALVVVILGGLGTLVGPLVGAVAFVLLKHELSAVTTYWHLVVGVVLIAVVMSRANGIYGWLEGRWVIWQNRRDTKIPHNHVTRETVSDA
ncbi:branched-chain amino acid ABC transporter permease [Sulfitobacter faviae]|uniref:branched-chain amino acid ABC transporter permease n=1 Tax=Sulfitobacter faviae TaxID=1775881 RepID=UPI0024559B39|nr:branched-chain amino acid ABC transporter permease [Sulfitobacter faviae]